MNINSNNAGGGGGSRTGCAGAGKGATGGNASSGNSGTAQGGDVRGSGGMMNVDSSTCFSLHLTYSANLSAQTTPAWRAKVRPAALSQEIQPTRKKRMEDL